MSDIVTDAEIHRQIDAGEHDTPEALYAVREAQRHPINRRTKLLGKRHPLAQVVGEAGRRYRDNLVNPSRSHNRRIDKMHDEILRLLIAHLSQARPCRSVRKIADAVLGEMRYDASLSTVRRVVTLQLQRARCPMG